MELKELEAALEGVLFAAGEPVGVERLCLGLEVDRATMDAVAQRLMDRYSYERRGIRLVRLDTSYQLCSAPEFAPYIRKTLENRKPARLSQPALEVLAVIAYYQPVTRAYVDQIGGWTAPIRWDCCWSGSSLRSAVGWPFPGGPSCTAQRKISCAPLGCPAWKSCLSCRMPPRRADS